MTANPLRAARGTTATLNTRVLKDGELAYNTTTDELHVGDGVTLGGRPISSEVDGDDIDVTATGGTTAIDLATRFGRMLTPEDFGAVGDGTTNDSTALQAWLDSGDKYLQCSGTYGLGSMVTIPKDVYVDAAGATFKPTAQTNMFRLHGAAKLMGFPLFNVTGYSGWNSVALLFDGASESSSTTSFRLHEPTYAQIHFEGVASGSGNGTVVKLATADDGVNNQWLMGLHVEAIGQGGDKVLHIVNAGAGAVRTFCNSNHFYFDWGSPLQSVVFENANASGYGIDGNLIWARIQSRSSSAQTSVPWVIGGQYNTLDFIQWDFDGNGGAVQGLTISAGARGNDIKFAGIAPALVTNNSSERTNRLHNQHHTGAGVSFGGSPFVLKTSAPASRTSSGNDGDIAADSSFVHVYRTTNTWERLPVSNWQVLARSFAAVSHTGTTSETTLATVTVPAGAMGANGVLRITSLWSYPNNANSKQLRIKFDGNNVLNTSPTTTAQHQTIITIGNRNSASSQVMGSGATASTGGLGNTGTAPATMSVNTALAKDIVFTVTLANSGDTATLEGYLIELSYGA